LSSDGTTVSGGILWQDAPDRLKWVQGAFAVIDEKNPLRLLQEALMSL
jgi:hypothetical protein